MTSKHDKKIVFSDIHGNKNSLKKIKTYIDLGYEIIFLGDIFDTDIQDIKNYHPLEILCFLIKNKDNVKCILGNHDKIYLDYIYFNDIIKNFMLMQLNDSNHFTFKTLFPNAYKEYSKQIAKKRLNYNLLLTDTKSLNREDAYNEVMQKRHLYLDIYNDFMKKDKKEVKIMLQYAKIVESYHNFIYKGKVIELSHSGDIENTWAGFPVIKENTINVIGHMDFRDLERIGINVKIYKIKNDISDYEFAYAPAYSTIYIDNRTRGENFVHIYEALDIVLKEWF